MAVNIGEAYVEATIRLDKLRSGLRTAERLVSASTQRMQRTLNQLSAIIGVGGRGGAGARGGLLGAGIAGGVAGGLFGAGKFDKNYWARFITQGKSIEQLGKEILSTRGKMNSAKQEAYELQQELTGIREEFIKLGHPLAPREPIVEKIRNIDAIGKAWKQMYQEQGKVAQTMPKLTNFFQAAGKVWNQHKQAIKDLGYTYKGFLKDFGPMFRAARTPYDLPGGMGAQKFDKELFTRTKKINAIRAEKIRKREQYDREWREMQRMYAREAKAVVFNEKMKRAQETRAYTEGLYVKGKAVREKIAKAPPLSQAELIGMEEWVKRFQASRRMRATQRRFDMLSKPSAGTFRLNLPEQYVEQAKVRLAEILSTKEELIQKRDLLRAARHAREKSRQRTAIIQGDKAFISQKQVLYDRLDSMDERSQKAFKDQYRKMTDYILRATRQRIARAKGVGIPTQMLYGMGGGMKPPAPPIPPTASAGDTFFDRFKGYKFGGIFKGVGGIGGTIAGGFGKFFDGFKSAASGAFKFVNKKFNSLVTNWRAALAKVAFVIGAIKITKAGTQIDAVTRSFTALSGGTRAAQERLSGLDMALRKTLTPFKQMRIYNAAMLLGIGKNSQKMQDMAVISRRLGRALGQDTSMMMDSLTMGIARQSRQLLDNLGIIVNAESAYERYAKKLKKTAASLSEAERKQAFFNAAMEAGFAKVAELGADINLSADAFEKTSSLLGRVYDTIKLSAADTFNFIFGSIDKWTDKNKDAQKSYDEAMQIYAKHMVQLKQLHDNESTASDKAARARSLELKKIQYAAQIYIEHQKTKMQYIDKDIELIQKQLQRFEDAERRKRNIFEINYGWYKKYAEERTNLEQQLHQITIDKLDKEEDAYKKRMDVFKETYDTMRSERLTYLQNIDRTLDAELARTKQHYDNMRTKFKDNVKMQIEIAKWEMAARFKILSQYQAKERQFRSEMLGGPQSLWEKAMTITLSSPQQDKQIQLDSDQLAELQEIKEILRKANPPTLKEAKALLDE